jgi:type III restriction enzyme
MKGINFEKNLPHQNKAVQSIVGVFKDLQKIEPKSDLKNLINPELKIDYEILRENILNIQKENGLPLHYQKKFSYENIIDIMMETGTGKTYTYTKAIFEINKVYGISKFVIIVPTVAIKAGTVSFLKSENCRSHFFEQYGKYLDLYIVEPKNNTKSKKSNFPLSVANFANASGYDKIQVLIINSGMINSSTLQKSSDKNLFDKFSVPLDAIAYTRPFVIIDEPHKFSQENKTWANIQKLKPQFILRFGATFEKFHNLIYTLTAVDAFNKRLVKGVIGHITEFESGKNIIIKLVSISNKEASFKLIDENNKDKSFKLSKGESLERIHSEMKNVIIEKISGKEVELSNGLILKVGDKINPFSYSKSIQEVMIEKAIENHFNIEKQLLTRSTKIKPLTLFFIDNIEEYRNENGSIKKYVEECIKKFARKYLEEIKDNFYKTYLQKTLENISETHGGYFSQDNETKDEAIENEINEILHDKEKLLSLDNPRRFIFSKWTLKEGWDNPNVFQICKLRSSGSEISKLQEVGRGLRLPVNEYGNRVKDEQFYLHYFVDFTESDFVDKLVNEVNEKSGTLRIDEIPTRLTDTMIDRIVAVYSIDYKTLLHDLINNKVIDCITRDLLPGGFDYIKQHYPLVFEGVDNDKIRRSDDNRVRKIKIRKEKYSDLKELWEKINERVALEYKFKNEEEFKHLLKNFFQEKKLTDIKVNIKTSKLDFDEDKAKISESESIYSYKPLNVHLIKYSDFLNDLSSLLYINKKTIHESIKESGININEYLSPYTVREIKQKFENYLLEISLNDYSIDYKKISNKVHPTKFTEADGSLKDSVLSSDIGIYSSNEKVAENYFLEDLFFDSELEKENIISKIDEVIVFTKIPKNSIKIPVPGGGSYSPDFAYVIKLNDGDKKLHLIVETKGKEEIDLSGKETAKMSSAEKLFQDAQKIFGGNVEIHFKKQLSNKKITDLIREILKEKCKV